MNTSTPPEGYKLQNVIDFRYNGKLVLLINLGMVGITVLLIWGMVQAREFSLLLPLEEDYTVFQRFLVPLSILIFLFFYIHIRELLHCLGFALLSRKKPTYRMRVFSAACGVPNHYFTKKDYLITTLFPIVVITVVLAFILLFLSNPWFWVVYIVLAFNLSSGVRDAYICSVVRDAPKGSLLWDDGRIIKVYAPSAQQQENN